MIGFNLKFYVSIFLYLISVELFSQEFFRIEAEYSIKENSSADSPMLNMGKGYFDINNRTLLFDTKFPEKEIVLMNDSLMLKIKNDEVVEVIHSQNFIDFTIFSLILNGKLPYFGLKNTRYALTNIEKDQGMVITTWEPPDEVKELKGKMLLSQIDKQLYGLISFDGNNKMISKQFFEEYITLDGINVPTRVTQFFYKGMEEKIKLTTYKNIKINNLENEEYYNYKLPAY